MNLPRIVLTVQGHRVDARVSRTEEDRAQGLMECSSLAEDEGMLFVHDEAIETCYWMKNTPLHLSIAFIDEEARILKVDEMTAGSAEGSCSAGKARFVLEMNQGWFQQRGITRGTQIIGLPAPTQSMA